MALYAFKTVLRLVPFMTICLSKSTHIGVESEALEIPKTWSVFPESESA
jgi:hypothetical protein